MGRPPAPTPAAPVEASAWWSIDSATLLQQLDSSPHGLASAEAESRRRRFGPNSTASAPSHEQLRLLARQFSSPLVLILVAGGLLSALLRDWVDAGTILAIVGISALLGFWQEMRASQAVTQLQRRLALQARVHRDGSLRTVAADSVVPGDVVELAAGQLVPADGVVLEARDLQVDQASLTGESFPVDKQPGVAAVDAPLAQRTQCLFVGSAVRSGTGRMLVVRTGHRTLLADLARRLSVPDDITEFERGARRFGELLLRVMFTVVVAVLVANQLLGRPVIESLLFAVALAVGLSPELLPAIVSVSLARGAKRLARAGVLVRRLDAIEDLGGMDVLCTDKTGTLTEGTVALVATLDARGQPDPELLSLAYVNAAFETGIDNPIDRAIVSAAQRAGLSLDGWHKLDEVPYDFVRRRLSVVVRREGTPGAAELVCKGAVVPVLAVCALADGERTRLEALAREHGERGLRVLALARRTVPESARFGVADESNLRFAGFLCFADPAKADAASALQALAARGVAVKMISGDNRHVAAHVAAAVGLPAQALLTGEAIASLPDAALAQQVRECAVFAEVDPAQKQRIVQALQHGGHAVGFLGDGINDAPALRAADVGISVDRAVDVARESADLVLLRPDLHVLERAIGEGRRTFANTLKYIQITTSANFGNMISMAVATPVLPFLPLTATQILLNNFLSDLPALAISGDRVDAAPLRRAQRWDLRQVGRFMLLFGLVSSLFDLLTFGLLIGVFHAGEAVFHSAWFVVSLLTELAVVMVLRTQGPAWRSRPSGWLLGTTLAVAGVAVALPYSGTIAREFGLVPLPASLLAVLATIVMAYVAATEACKRRFFAA